MNKAKKAAPIEMREASQRVLQSVVDVTENKDCQRFRKSLCDTLAHEVAVTDAVFLALIEEEGPAVFRVTYRWSGRPARVPRLIDIVRSEPGLLENARLLQLLSRGHLIQDRGGAKLLWIPILRSDKLTEIMILRAEFFSVGAINLIKSFSQLYRNFSGLINESERDPLTGLYNRRTLDVQLRRTIELAFENYDALINSEISNNRRPAGDLSPYLAIVDIDHFKRINDTLGHLFGDEVIILVSRLLKKVFREHDSVFRYGGEEFVVILLAPDDTSARAALDRFRKELMAQHFPQLDSVTSSAGFVKIADGEVPSVVVGKADKALYRSKENGRNQVTSYEEICETAESANGENYDAEMF